MISSLAVPVMVATVALTGTAGPANLSGLDRAVDSTVVVSTISGHGAGVYLGEGRVLTAAHVVQGTARITAGTDRVTAEVVSRDPGRDLALLQLDEDVDLPAATFRDSPAHVGERVYAAGAPADSYVQVSSGIVSAVVEQSSVSRVQTDAPVNPGNSGGPLLDESGQVIGIVVTKSADDEGIGWATASQEVDDFLAEAVGGQGQPTPQDPSADSRRGGPAEAPSDTSTDLRTIVGVTASVLAALGVTGSIAWGRRRRTRPASGPILDLSDLGADPSPTRHAQSLQMHDTNGRAPSPTSTQLRRTP